LYLANRKVIGKGFKSGFITAPPRESDTELVKLVERLRSGDNSTIERIILGHLGLTIQIVGRYVSYFPNKSDDLMSVASVALTEAVGRFPKTARNNNITGYIVSTIHGRISDYLKEEDRTVKISSHERKRVKEKSDEDHTVGFLYTNSIEFDYLEKSNSRLGDILRSNISYTVPDNLEFQEIIDKCCFTRFEYLVYSKMMEGMTEAEISKEMRISKQRINIVKKDLIRKIHHHRKSFDDKVGDLVTVLNKFWEKK